MTVQFQVVTSLQEIDFDAMFQGSYPTIDNNYLWPESDLTYDQKKAAYLSQLTSAINGEWDSLVEGEQMFMCSTTCDGVMMEFVAGFIEADGFTYRTHWYLTSPDANGSKNVIHVTDTRTVRKAFYNSNGITRYKALTIKLSTFYKWVKLRVASGALVLIDEYPTPGTDINSHLGFVTLILEA